jgi:hypothetical protein
VYFFARDQADETLLEVTLPPLLDEVVNAEVTFTYTLPVQGMEIAVSTGRDVGALACTDVADGRPKVAHHWVAVEGNAVLVATPGATPDEAVRGTLTIEDVRLEGDLQPLQIDSFTFEDHALGVDAG